MLSEVADLCPNFNSGAMKNKRGKNEERFSKHNLKGKEDSINSEGGWGREKGRVDHLSSIEKATKKEGKCIPCA